MKFSYPLKEKILFYLGYFVHKTFSIWVDVKRPKLRMFAYEMAYSALKVIKGYEYIYPSPFETDFVHTRFGRFRIRPHTSDMSNVSPAFERRDVDYLLKLIGGLARKRRRILFLDIGADIGTFAVAVGNTFKDYDGLAIAAFEPSPSFSVLEENIRLNGIRADLYNFALWSADNAELEFSFNRDAPGSSGIISGGGMAWTEKVRTMTLDSAVGGRAKDFDVLIFKMDVEGAEEEVLKGAAGIIASGKEIYLIVEDFVRADIVGYLEGIGAEFIRKLTPYNSFWKLGGGSGQ